MRFGTAAGRERSARRTAGRLSSDASVTVSAPAAELSVADARVDEAPGAELAFLVTLDAAVPHRVKVDYATSDGTATAG